VKRHLKRLKQFLTLSLLIVLSQLIVNEVQAQTIETPVGVSCTCDPSLAQGWKLLDLTFNGTAGTNFIIGAGNDILTTGLMPIPPAFNFIEGAAGSFSGTIIINANGNPSISIGYNDAMGNFVSVTTLNSFPISCEVSEVDITPANEVVCISSLSTEFTAFIPADNPAISYTYQYEFYVDGMLVQASSLDDTYDFPNTMVVPPTVGVHIVSVIAEQFDLGGVTTGCTYEDFTVITVFDLSAFVAIQGEDEICNTTDPVNFNLNIDEFDNGQIIDWSLKDDSGMVLGNFPSTGSGAMIDFNGQPVGNYSICVSGMTDDDCVFATDFDVLIFNPGGTITGPATVMCGSVETYTVVPDGGVTDGTVWTATNGTITSSNNSTATVEWDMATTGSVTASGITGDGCSYEITYDVTFESSADSFSIEGDTYVCSGELAQYTVVGPSDLADNFNYSWALFDSAGTDISDSPCPLLGTTNAGQSQPIDFSCLAPGDYTLVLNAASNNGCPDMTLSTTITVADPDDIQSIACVSGGLNVTIGNNCQLLVTADLLLQGAGSVNNDGYDIVLVDTTTGEMIDGNILDHTYINRVIEVKVVDQCSGNSCWGFITVEDKSIPTPTCPNVPGTITCEEASDKSNEDFMPIFDADVTVTPTGDNTWLLTGYDNCGDAFMTCEDVNNTIGDCANPTFITRIWTITDEFGATASCSVNFTILIDEDEMIIFPDNFDDVIPGAEPSIDVCSDFPRDGIANDQDPLGNPDPSFTGMPEAASCSEVIVLGYTDTNLALCGNDSPARKVIREWVIWNPCGNGGLGDEVIYTQYITLTDNSPPICAAFNEFAVTTESHTCSATIFVPQPEVSNECGTVFIDLSYKLRDDNGIIPALFSEEGVTYSAEDQGFYIDDVTFASDSLWVLFEVRDGCGNGTTGCLTEVALLDDTPPTPVCDLFNNVALNADGCAYAGPSTFDDNSYDNCDVYQTVIKRMDDGAPCGDCTKPQYDFLNYLGEFDGHHYYLSKDPTTGPKSFAYANAIESHVATIETAAEGTWLSDQVNLIGNDSYFIGYRGVGISNADSPANSAFDAQGGGVMVYDNWAAGEPDWTLSGTGDIYVNVLPNGTWAAERGSIANFKYVVEVEDPCVFSQQVKFCCADIGNEVMVRTRVFDAHGNFAECMVQVTVQDFKAPTLDQPAPDSNITLDCEDLEDTDYLLGAASDDLLDYGVATFSDNCSVVVDYDVDISNASDCGSFNIIRTWTATDPYGNSETFTQTINVGELTPFNGSNIDFPDDFDSMNCNGGVEPEDLPVANAFPRFIGVSACSNVTAAHEDQVFNYTEIACSKILRTWTVIDWCQPDEEWVHIQVIKIFDTEGPTVFSGCQDLNQVIGESVGSCMIQTYEPGLNITITDNCSNFGEITVWYDLDLDNDGDFEAIGIQSDDANGVYPYGTHYIKWYAEDDCGNVMPPCDMTFVVDGDSDGPTAYCLTEVVTTIPVAGSVEIWAEDFDQGSYGGTCNETDDLTFSFSSNTSNTNQSFDCSDLVEGVTDTIELQMWVTDSNGNQSFCTTHLILQDNHDACPDSGASRAAISGKVYTEKGEMVDDVEMSLMSGSVNPMMTYMTTSGEYDFNNVPLNNNYQVEAYNNNNPLNGVSTLDILLIQKHILSIQSLDSPYKLIAADVNNSESISALDLSIIRKLILGLYSEFPNNDSWTFVDQNFVFAQPTTPWPFSETIIIDNLVQDMVDEDFIAIKLGDVNGTVVTNFNAPAVEHRSGATFEMKTKSTILENGNTQVEFLSTKDAHIFGAQFSLLLENAELEDVVAGAMEIAEYNFTIANNELLVSYDEVNGLKVSEGDVMFALELSSAQVLQLTETLKSEVYVEGAGGVETIGVELQGAVESISEEFAVYQNTPNPFSEETTIAFELPNTDEVFIQIFDNSGKVLFAKTGVFERGYNEISVSQDELETTGILYYQISTNSHIATRKMIVLK